MKIFKKTRSYFYFSGYPRDSKFFDLVNKNVIDKMKDEFKGNIVSEFDGLKSKMYYLVDVDGRGIKKAKGVNRGVVMGIMHKEFVGVLFGGEWWDIKWKELEVNYIELELMIFPKFHCLVLMIKDSY